MQSPVLACVHDVLHYNYNIDFTMHSINFYMLANKLVIQIIPTKSERKQS